MVVVGHSAYISMSSSIGGVNYELGEFTNAMYYSPFFCWMRDVAGWVYGFHMPLFFFLSGAVLALKPIGKFDDFVVNKAKRLIIPFFVAGLLFMLPVKWISGFYNNESIKSAIGLFLSGGESGHLWFVFALFWVMVVFTIMQKAIEKYTGNNQMLLWIGAWIIQMNVSIIPFNNFSFGAGMLYIFWFACGWMFEKYIRKLINNRIAVMLFVLSTLLDFLNGKYIFFNSDFIVIIGITWTVSLAYIGSRLFRKCCDTKAYKVVLRNLFNIYLFHDPLEYVVLKLSFTYNWLESDIGCYFYIFLRTIGVFFISIMLGEVLNSSIKRIRNICMNAHIA